MLFRTNTEKVLFATAVLLALIAIGLIFPVAQYTDSSGAKHVTNSQRISELLQHFLGDDFSQSKTSSARYMTAHLANISGRLHVAGTADNELVSEYIYNTWRTEGLDKVEFVEYDNVLLSTVDYEKPNTIEVIGSSGARLLSSGLGGFDERSDETNNEATMSAMADSRARVWWNAYSVPGIITALPVYVNYCTADDFFYLARTGINVTGKILVCRFGKAKRGSKAQEAARWGAKGLVLFSDAPDRSSKADQYPQGVRLPYGAAQRGTLSMLNIGDPLTPMYPAKDYAYRWYSPEELRYPEQDFQLPAIPVTSIGYGDALKLLEAMNAGISAPDSWSIPIGQGTNRVILNGSEPFRLTVSTRDRRGKIRNVIGRIRGTEDPDKYVLVSNHYDAWAYGAIDSTSSTIVMLEVSRVLMETVRKLNWRPKRSIVFAAWDAEEFGCIGSGEWIEENLKDIMRNAIAVINLDIGVSGNATFAMAGVPLLYRAVLKATSSIENPLLSPDKRETESNTVYEHWLEMCPNGPVPNDPRIPRIDPPGGGSDDHGFLVIAGVPTLWMGFLPNCDTSILAGYELYHTMFDTNWLLTNLVDPENLKISRTLARIVSEVLIDISDAVVIPFNTTDYAEMLQSWIEHDLLVRFNSSEGGMMRE